MSQLEAGKISTRLQNFISESASVTVLRIVGEDRMATIIDPLIGNLNKKFLDTNSLSFYQVALGIVIVPEFIDGSAFKMFAIPMVFFPL